MKTEGSSPHSQMPATCPYPEPARSSPYPHILLPEDPMTEKYCHFSSARMVSHRAYIAEAPVRLRVDGGQQGPGRGLSQSTLLPVLPCHLHTLLWKGCTDPDCKLSKPAVSVIKKHAWYSGYPPQRNRFDPVPLHVRSRRSGTGVMFLSTW